MTAPRDCRPPENTPESGEYRTLSGRLASCIVCRDGLVRVFYPNGDYTCANIPTFLRWGWTIAEPPHE